MGFNVGKFTYGRILGLMGILSYIVIAIFLVTFIGYWVFLESFWWGLGAGILMVLCLWVAFLPLWIARVRKHPHSLAIFLINLLLGWTLLFWLVALIWAFVGKEEK